MTGPLPSFLSPITVPASWVYERVINARNRKYDRPGNVQKLSVPVISVGNVTTGGTGKTPMVMWITRFLVAQGRHPAIAMRGYGASDENSADEAIEYAEQLPDVPLIVDADRATACSKHLQSQPTTDCIVLDDGFQHRGLHRDLDLVLIDATANTFHDRLLPAGHLREPLKNLARADAVILTRADTLAESDDSNLDAHIARFHGKGAIARTRHTWTALNAYFTAQDEQSVPVDWLKGKRVVTLLGVGNPAAIIAQLEHAGTIVAANVPASDHERFTSAKLTIARGLCEGLDALIMTAKDWARSRKQFMASGWPVPIIVPELAIDIVQGRDALEQLILDSIAD